MYHIVLMLVFYFLKQKKIFSVTIVQYLPVKSFSLVNKIYRKPRSDPENAYFMN